MSKFVHRLRCPLEPACPSKRSGTRWGLTGENGSLTGGRRSRRSPTSVRQFSEHFPERWSLPTGKVTYRRGVREAREPCKLHVPTRPHFVHDLGHLSARHLLGVAPKLLSSRTCSCRHLIQVNTVPGLPELWRSHVHVSVLQGLFYLPPEVVMVSCAVLSAVLKVPLPSQLPHLTMSPQGRTGEVLPYDGFPTHR